MRPICRHSVFILLAGALLLGGCSPVRKDVYTNEEWLQAIRQRAGIGEGSSETDAEVLVKYGVMAVPPEDMEAALTREYAAYTLVNLKDAALQKVSIRDIDETDYPEQVQTAVSEGMFQLDIFHCFHPRRLCRQTDAEVLLDQTVAAINDQHFAAEEKIAFREDIPVLDIQPLAFDEEKMTVLLMDGTDLSSYQGIRFQGTDGHEEIYDIDHAEETDEGLSVSLKEADLLSYTDQIEVAGEAELDFSHAEIITGEENPSAVLNSDPYLDQMSYSRTKTFSAAGYTIRLKTGSSGISVDLTKSLANHLQLSGRLKLSGTDVQYRFSALKKDIKNAYFKVNLHTEESLKVTSGSYKKLYGDFSAVKPQNFLSSLKGFLKPASEMETAEIPICKIRIPLEGVGLVSVTARLSVVIYASGKASLVLSQDNVCGMEMRGGVPRFIHEYSHSETNSIRADTAVTARCSFALEALKTALMDVGVEAGAKAALHTTVHLYDEEGQMEDVSTDLNADALNGLASGNPGVLVCTDMNACLLLRLRINSARTLAGKFGLSGTVSLLDEDSGSVFGGTRHFENWHQVKTCTRKNRAARVETTAVPETDRLTISSYAMAVKQNEAKQTQITGMPSGYRASDLVYSSSSSCVSVTSNGLVTGLSPGAAVVTIATADGRYQVECSILVTEGKIS